MTGLSLIEEALQKGDIVAARSRLNRLTRTGKSQKLPVAQIANLFWRVGWPKRGLRHLSRKIVEAKWDILKAHPKEAAEYSACLIRLGAFEDAKSILQTPEILVEAQSNLYLGFAYLETWDYEHAIPYFEKYVRQPKLKSYAKLVGYANLACSLVYEKRHKTAQPILNRLLHDSQVSKNQFLLGYVLEGIAANAVLSGKPTAAERYLSEAEARWKAVQGPDKLFLEKWRAISKLLEQTNAKSLKGMEKVKAAAILQQQWETVRDCDRYLALATGDKEIFFKVYFGTPYEAFRKRLKADFGSVEFPKIYEWKMGLGAKGRSSTDCLSSVDARKKIGLAGQNLALFSALAKDFYRAHRLGTIFGWMYPEERYHFSSTPRRIQEAVRRLSLWFESERIPLEVLELHSSYALHATRPYALLMANPDSDESQWGPLVQRLRRHFEQREFATGDAEKVIGIPRRTLIRQLQNLVASRHLTRTGTGATTRYRVVLP